MMKSIAIYCVTYNSYKETQLFIESVNTAAGMLKGVEVVVFVADNTEKECQIILTDYPNIKVEPYIIGRNLGYFGAVKKCMQKHKPISYDYVIISNVDIVVNEKALKRLSELSINDDIGWLAPMIFSTSEKRDRNPKILSRYSKRKLQILKLLYSYPWLNRLYEQTLYRRKSIKSYSHKEGEEIYAGHGSFIILTKTFFSRIGMIDYPVFLFGEEIYLAEQCRKYGLKTIYVPSILITDSDHCSTSKMKSSFYYKCNLESIKYILNEFYNE